MTGPTPTDPGDLRPIQRTDRRWMVVPASSSRSSLVAIVKPWGGEREP